MGKHGGNQGGKPDTIGLSSLKVGEERLIPWRGDGWTPRASNSAIAVAMHRARKRGWVIAHYPTPLGLMVKRYPDGSTDPGNRPAPGVDM